MNPILYAIPVFMLTIGLEAWVAKRRARPVYDIPDAITSLHHGVLSQVIGLFVKVLTVGIYVGVHEHARLFDLPADSVFVFVAALIAYDFCYYWAHRLGHEVNILWAAHVVHHSSEYYNLATALRQTSSGPLLGWIFYLPLAVCGVPPTVFVAVAVIDLLYQYWVHTELVPKLGWIDRVFCTPSNHRVHHGQNDYCIDRNYGGILMIWDHMFGTFVEERDDEPIRFGIRKPLQSFNPVWGNLHYYADLWRMSRAAPTWRGKLGVWFAPPGGWHQPLPHFDPSAFRHFSAGTPASLRRYVALQYAASVPFVMDLIGRFDVLSPGARLVYALGILATTLALGALLEGRHLARRLEVLRALALGLAVPLLPTWFGLWLPLAAQWTFAVVMLGGAAWLVRHIVASR